MAGKFTLELLGMARFYLSHYLFLRCFYLDVFTAHTHCKYKNNALDLSRFDRNGPSSYIFILFIIFLFSVGSSIMKLGKGGEEKRWKKM